MIGPADYRIRYSVRTGTSGTFSWPPGACEGDMRILLAGATGVVGTRALEALVDRGHEVIGMSRDEAGDRQVMDRGATAVRGDVLEPSTIERLAATTDPGVLIHAATAIPTDDRPTADAWEHNDRVREQGARTLLEAFGGTVDRVVFPSVVWVARQSDGRPFDESDPVDPDRTTRSAAAVESYLETVAPDFGFDPLILRLGFLYGPESAHTIRWGERLLTRSLPTVGGGLLGRRPIRWSFLYSEDAGRAIATGVEAGLEGTYHVVDAEPASTAAFFSTFAARLDAPRPRRIPAWVARRMLDPTTARMVTTAMPTTNERFSETTGWEPQYPTYEEGLHEILDTWPEGQPPSESSKDLG